MCCPSWLDLLADIYTPLLALACLRHFVRAGPALRRRAGAALLINLSIAWGLMYIDHWLAIWPAWSLDYSTHTAVALAFIVFLAASRPAQGLGWLATLAGYGALMIALGYHSLPDLLSTAAVAGILMLSGGIAHDRAVRQAGTAG